MSNIKMVAIGATKQVCLLSAAVLLVAGACFSKTAVSLSPSSGPPTSKLLVSGSGFKPHAAIDIFFDTKEEAKVIANRSGSFSKIAIQAPSSALPGKHWVSAIRRPGQSGAQALFLINTNWSQFHFTPGGTRLNPYENVLSPKTVSTLELKWSYPAEVVESSPVVVDGVAYVSSWHHNVYAIKVDSGVLLWSYATGGSGGSSPAVVKGVVYVGSDDGNVYALNSSTGALLWKYTTGNVVRSSPAVVNGVVYVGSIDGNLYALDAASGTELWSYPTNSWISSPTVKSGIVYVGSADHNIYALDASTGTALWTYTTGDEVFSSPAVAKGVVYIGSNDGNVYALTANNGDLLWSYTTGNSVLSSPAVANGVVYIGSRDDNVYALNASTGAKLWSYTTGWFVDSSPAVANGVVYVGSEDDSVYALDASTGARLWSYNTGANIFYSSPTVVNGVVYIGSQGNNGTGNQIAFYAFAQTNSDRVKHSSSFQASSLTDTSP